MSNQELIVMLQQCSLLELLIIVQPLLAREGFGEIELLDRLRTTQKSKRGGIELLSHLGVGITPMTCAIKVINDDIRVRMLSELVGTVDRLGADMGIIITPKKLCRSAEKEAPNYTSTKLMVFDGGALADLMRKYEVGVRPNGSVDYAFFGNLERFSHLVEFALGNLHQ